MLLVGLTKGQWLAVLEAVRSSDEGLQSEIECQLSEQSDWDDGIEDEEK